MAQWLDIDNLNIHSYCGSSFGKTLGLAILGNDLWMHDVNEDHWFIIDLKGNYEITKVRGRSKETWDPIGIIIYVSEDLENWGVSLTPPIHTWQDTDQWQEIGATTKIGRYVKVLILGTEDPGRILGFGSSATWGDPPFAIFDVYGERVPVDVELSAYCLSEITARGDLVGVVGLPFAHTVHASFTTQPAILGGYIPLAGTINANSTLEGTLEKGTIPITYTLTFSDVVLCPGASWPGTIDLNQAWELTEDDDDSDLFRYQDGNWLIELYFNVDNPLLSTVQATRIEYSTGDCECFSVNETPEYYTVTFTNIVECENANWTSNPNQLVVLNLAVPHMCIWEGSFGPGWGVSLRLKGAAGCATLELGWYRFPYLYRAFYCELTHCDKEGTFDNELTNCSPIIVSCDGVQRQLSPVGHSGRAVVAPGLLTGPYFDYQGIIPRFETSEKNNANMICTGFVLGILGKVLIVPGVQLVSLAGEIKGISSVAGSQLNGIVRDLESTNSGILYSTSKLSGIFKDIKGVNTGILYSTSELSGIAVHLTGAAAGRCTATGVLSGIAVKLTGSVEAQSGVGI